MKHPFAYAAAFAWCIWVTPFALAQNRPTSSDAPLPATQVGLPSLGLAGDDAFSQRDERTLGMLLWREVRHDSAFVQDPLVTAYLQRLVNGLAQGLSQDEQGAFRVYAVADTQLNAFAMPGRLLGIHSGLILSVAREGELAAVLAHEIGHVSQRHFARRVADQKNNQWIGWAGLAAAVLAARNTSNASSGSAFEGALLGSQALLASKQLGFSRDMEREADAVGLQLLKKAHYDGGDMVRMLRRLAAGASLNDAGTGYARSHPGTTERMANVEGRLRSAATPLASPDTGLDFLLAQARLRSVVATSGDERASADYALTQGLASHSAQVRLASVYGLAVLHQQRNDPAQALAVLQKFGEPTLTHPWVTALQAELGMVPASPSPANYPELAHGQARAVLRANAAHLANPASAPLVAATADWTATVAALNAQLVALPHSDLAWADLADIYNATQQHALAAYAQAERMAVQGAWASALSFLNQAIALAKRSGQINLQAAWVQRENALKTALAEERAFEQKQK